jgi:UDP-GlcNAc3NAcA epimerase
MKLVSVVGARPQFVKMAALARSVERHNSLGSHPIDSIIVHTGQHYDSGLSDVFFDELDIPPATFNLAVGSGPHGRQTGQMLERLETVLLETRPDMVLIYGDTNSSVAGALAAAKLHIPVAHVEAGVRSFNRRMPEEVNRIITDHASDMLLAPTPTAMANLEREGLARRAILTGDVMYDAVLAHIETAERRTNVPGRLGLASGAYGVVTVHRAENTDDRARLEGLLTIFNDIATTAFPLVFPIHPRTAAVIESTLPEWTPAPRLHVMPPVGYLDMLHLVRHARMTLTDSGGLQKEAFFLGCPCTTLRNETEWIETVQGMGNILAGVEPTGIREAVLTWQRRLLDGGPGTFGAASAVFGDGRAADRIVAVLAGGHGHAPAGTETTATSTLEERPC